MKITLKHIWSFGLVLMLLMFALMFFNDHRWRGELKGDITYQQKPEFSTKTWLDGTYQKGMQKYLEENIGVRNYFIRSRNQIYFSVFREAKARDVELGSNNICYEANYLEEYFGLNAIKPNEMKQFIDKAKEVKKALGAQGKELLIVVAPGKASMFPNNFPSKWKNQPKKRRNRDYVVSTLNQNNIPVMDASSWFVKIKDEVKYPLYSETGIHWTHYGEYLFMDSLSKYLNSKGLTISTLSVKKFDVTATPVTPDDDVEQGMNLLFDIPNKPLAYPHVWFKETKNKSNALLIGDSYLWHMFESRRYDLLFDKFWYYYYNVDRYAKDYRETKTLSEEIIKEDLNQANCVILLCTEANLDRLYFNSINDLYEVLVVNKSVKK